MTIPAGYSAITVPADRPNANGIAHRNHLVLLQIDGVWCSPTSQAAALQALIDNADPLPDRRQDLLDQVAAELARRDAALLGDADAQFAQLTSAVSLLAKITYLGGSLTPAETAEADDVFGTYGSHLALAAAAAAIAGDVYALTTASAAFAFDVAGDPRWTTADATSIVFDSGVFAAGVFADGLTP